MFWLDQMETGSYNHIIMGPNRLFRNQLWIFSDPFKNFSRVRFKTKFKSKRDLKCLVKCMNDWFVVFEWLQNVWFFRKAQKELKDQITGLEDQLRIIEEEQGCPIDLEMYINKLNSAKKRVIVVNNILQGAQVDFFKLKP